MRLGLLPSMMAQLGKRSGERGVAGLVRDGDRIVAVIGLAGFKSAHDNHWFTLSISPACEESVELLSALAHKLVDADSIRLEGGSPWRN